MLSSKTDEDAFFGLELRQAKRFPLLHVLCQILSNQGQWKSLLLVSNWPSHPDRSTNRLARRCTTSPSF
jgi:hypothetical protein